MKKINVAELLKDCPHGMELDCVLFNNTVRYDGLDNDDNYPIIILTENDDYLYLTEEGYLYNMPNSKCVIFPKDKTTWEGFVPPCQFKDGDILYVNANYDWIFIYQKEDTECLYKYAAIRAYTNPADISYISICDSAPLCCKDDVSEIRPATEEETERLFKAIKDNGYEWNPKTKTLEKLVEPKFKVGDKVRHKTYTRQGYTVTEIKDTHYILDDESALPFVYQDYWELVPNKFDINTLVPFESKVLVRNDESQYWIPAFWGYKRDDGYTTTFGWSKYCIPFDGNENLLSTNNDCDKYYKIWD